MAVKLLLVDGLNLVRRVHAGQTASSREAASDAVKPCVTSLRRALRETQPTHVACAFDGPGQTWRHRLSDDYKAGRKPMPEALREALPEIRSAFGAMGVACLQVPETEADDLIASIATKVAAQGGQVTVLSTDRAFCSLLSERISIRDHFARRTLKRSDVADRFGVPPELLVDLWSLSGFPGNGIAGAPGVGPKTAVRLLEAHGDLDGVMQAAQSMDGRMGEILRASEDAARLSKRLVGLRTDVEIGMNLRELRWQGRDALRRTDGEAS